MEFLVKIWSINFFMLLQTEMLNHINIVKYYASSTPVSCLVYVLFKYLKRFAGDSHFFRKKVVLLFVAVIGSDLF